MYILFTFDSNTVKQKHAEYVPDRLSEQEFWTRFFQSHYFHRDRINVNSKDLFAECAVVDEHGKHLTDGILKRHGPFVAFNFYCKIMLYGINYTYYSVKTVKICFHVPFRG